MNEPSAEEMWDPQIVRWRDPEGDYVVKDTELSWSTLKTLRSTRATRVAEVHGVPAARLILGHDENSASTMQAYVNLNGR